MSQKAPPMVVFDIGGVLVRISNTWQEAALVAGIKTILPVASPVYLEDLPAFVEYQVGAVDESTYLDHLGRELGVTAAEALLVHDGILVEPFVGTSELVCELESKGVVTGILSNTNRPHWEVLDDPSRYAVIASIDNKMPSHEVGLQKPDPRIFHLYAARLGFQPERIVYFDDNARNIAAALSVGWRATQIDPINDPVAQMRKVLAREGILKGS